MTTLAPVLADELTTSSADYQRLAWTALLPEAGDDFWTWCGKHLRTHHGTPWLGRRARLFKRWYDLVGARLSGRPVAGDPCAHRCEELWVVAPAQIAKSTFLHAIGLYAARNHPRPLALYLGRSLDLADTRKNRVERQLLAMPTLERLLPRGIEARERALGQRSWVIGTALWYWLCGNVADDLRKLDLPLMLLDEIETYGNDIDGFGDPIELAHDRQRTYGGTRLMVGATSPGGISGHGWRRLCSGSHERPLVACADCGGVDWLNPRQVVLTEGTLQTVPPKAILAGRLGRWACRWCGALHGADAVRSMVRDGFDRWCPGTWTIDADHPQGHWTAHADVDSNGRLIAIAPTESTVRSCHVNALYAIEDVTVDQFAAATALGLQGTASVLTAKLNSDWAEPAIRVVTNTDDDTSTIRALTTQLGYERKRLDGVPDNGWLALHFDQQGNVVEHWWFPWVLRYVVPGGASWLVDAGKCMTDAARDTLEDSQWMINGQAKGIDITTMDSANGNVKWHVYMWASNRSDRRILLLGDTKLPDGTPWAEVVDRADHRRKTAKPANVREYRIAAHHWRDILWDRIRGRSGAPWHLPRDVEDFYLRSLTSEEQVLQKRRVAGGGFRELLVWTPRVLRTTGDHQTFRNDNHWWDQEASHLALCDIMRWNDPEARSLSDLPVVGEGWG